MNDPRPIETAPKDGTAILVYDLDIGWTEAQWSVGNRWGEECWHPTRSWEADGSSTLYPTHWLPLPVTPTSDKRTAQ